MGFKSIRVKHGMSQIELAETLGVTQGAVSQWETGQSIPRGATLLRLAEALNCTVDELLRSATDTKEEGKK